MATFNITRDGATYRVSVPDEQAGSVTPESLLAILDGAQPSAPPNEPTGAGVQALQQGLNTAGRGVASSLRVGADAVGDTMVGRGLRSASEFVEGITPDAPAGYVPSGPAVADAYNRGDYGEMLRNVPGMVAESAPGMAATIGAGALGTAVGGPVAGLAAAGATSAAQTFGPVAEARAQNNNTVPHDPANMAAAGVTTAGVAAIDAATGMGGRLLRPGAAGLVPRVGRATGVAAAEAGGEAAQDAIQQVGETAGTERGLTYDPGQTVAAGLAGGATRGAMNLPGAAVRGAGESVARAGADAVVGDIPAQQAESYVRMADLYERRAADAEARTGRRAEPEDVLNAARTEVGQQLSSFVKRAEEAGWLEQQHLREGVAMRDLVQTALSHNRTLVTGEPGSEFSLAEGLGQIDRLTRAPDIFRQNMRALLTDLDVLSRSARKNKMTGPFEAAGRIAGQTASVGIGAATGGPMGALAGAAMAVGGNPISARIGGAVGRGVDKMLGIHQPVVLLARRKAERIVRKAGGNPGDTRRLLSELDRVLTDERLSERAAAGLPVDADTMARLAAEAAQKKADREAAERQREEDAQVQRWIDATNGNPALESKVRRARSAAEARVKAAIARDMGAVAAARVKAEKAAARAEAAAATATEGVEPPMVVEKATRRAKAKAKPKPAPQTSPEAPPAPPAPGPAPEVQPPAETPPAPAQGQADTPADTSSNGGGHTYVRSVLFSKGDLTRTTVQDIDAALARMAESGDLDPDMADRFTGNTGNWPPSLAVRVAREIARSRGNDIEGLPDVADRFGRPLNPGGGAGPAPGFYRPDVADPASWQGKADAVQAHLARMVERAAAAGDAGLEAVLVRFQTKTAKELSEPTRRGIAQVLVNAGDPQQRALRRVALAPWLEDEATPQPDIQPDIQDPPAPPKRGRGRPRKVVAEPDIQPNAEPEVSGGDGLVAMGSKSERVEATDALVRRVEEAFARTSKSLREKIMGDDLEAADKAEAQLQKNEAKLREIRAANAAWRTRTTETGKTRE